MDNLRRHVFSCQDICTCVVVPSTSSHLMVPINDWWKAWNCSCWWMYSIWLANWLEIHARLCRAHFWVALWSKWISSYFDQIHKKITIFTYQICFVESIIIKYTFMCCSISLCYHRVPLAIHDGNNNAWYIRKFGQITLNDMFTEHCILLSLSPKKNNIYHFTVLTESHTLRGNSILYQYSWHAHI